MPKKNVASLAEKFPEAVRWGDVLDQNRPDVNTGRGCSAAYAEEVRLLLEKHFGTPVPSLTLDAPPRGEKNTRYFLILDDAEKEKIRALRDTFNALPAAVKAGFPELIQPEAKPKPQRQAIRCVKLQMNREVWVIQFYILEGVKYHRSLGRTIAAALLPGKRPFITLSSDAPASEFYGLWNPPQDKSDFFYPGRNEGMRYSVNKNLMENRAFRGFVVGFLRTVAAAEKKHILKDAARTIERCGCFLPQLSFPALLKFHTPGEIIASVLPARNVLNRNLNTLDLNAGYVAARFLSMIDPQDRPALSRITAEDVHRVLANAPSVLFHGMGTRAGVTAYLDAYTADKFRQEPFDFNPSGALAMARDYLNMCENLHVKIRYGLEPEAYLRAHDELARLQRDRIEEQEDAKPLITEPSGFDKLEAVLPGEFTRMRSTRQLRLEGQRQRNCAFSRRGLLRSDTAAIFHWDCGEKSYTVQFGILPNGRYSIDEMRGRCNEPCLPEHRRKLEGLLRGINRKGALGA